MRFFVVLLLASAGGCSLQSAAVVPEDRSVMDAGSDTAVAPDTLPGTDTAVDAGMDTRPDTTMTDSGCVPSAERCNARDDDCDDTVDEGFNLDLDPLNCGECGRVCEGGDVCNAGACADS